MIKRISTAKKGIKMSWKEPDRLADKHNKLKAFDIFQIEIVTKGQLNSEWTYEVIISPKMPTNNLRITALEVY